MSERIPVQIDPDLKDLIPGFLENRAHDAERLEALLAAKDFDEIRLVGHSMKGVGGGYGFDAITDYGAEIEQGALAQDEQRIRDNVSALRDYLARVDVVLEE